MSGFGGFGPAQGIIATAVVDQGSVVSGGSNNGVLYVNSSGNLDSGTGLTWDGSAILSLVSNSAAIKLGASSDVVLTWDAANILAQRNGTNAQAFHLYGTFTSSSVYERLAIKYDSVDTRFEIFSEMAGASHRALALGAGGNPTWILGTSGELTSVGNYRFAHGTSALATTATEGYFHMNSAAGAPTGVPTTIPTGQIPMVFDTTNARLYFYHAAAWHYVAQTA